MNTRGPRQLLSEVQQAGLCVGCGSCVELCPYFRSHGGKTVMLHDCDLSEGRCHAWCPKTELDLESLAQALWGEAYAPAGVGPCLSVAAAQAGPALGEGVYQGGGVVSALAAAALELGMVDGVVLTGGEALEPTPIVARNLAEIKACTGSKFAAAPTLAALNRTQAAGGERLGVVATPCQGAALAQRGLKPVNQEAPTNPADLVLGLFCNWALDPRGLAAFLASRVELKRIRSMDIPPPPAGVLVVRTDHETLEIPLDEIRGLVPPGCAICPDMTSEWADLSVGMFEGRPGWNTLIVRSEKGRDLAEAALERGWLVLEEMPKSNWEHLDGAAQGKRLRGLRAANQQGLLGTADDPEPKALRVGAQLMAQIEKATGEEA
ncbi:MAG: Coenzyme F420 hydrogenase/dehydrogenase, beta subunit C-terminal domain [Desulfarculaceae bacterium]|nr:Coenzyme F420 hydrogenase/dehydrogenase, beta subunit C-terminal domain [Desulfarculaceae bacterium]